MQQQTQPERDRNRPESDDRYPHPGAGEPENLRGTSDDDAFLEDEENDEIEDDEEDGSF